MHSKKKKTFEEYDQDGQQCMLKQAEGLFSEVKMCMTSPEGNKLMHEAGIETDALEPKKYVVPWITVNGIFDFDTYYEIR